MKFMNGSEALLDILRNEKVDHIFGIPGATETFFMDALEDYPEFKYILGLNEIAMVGAAEGYARSSGKTSFLYLHTGTGLAAGLPMLSNAYYGGVPMVVTAGQQDSRLLASEPAMSGNLVKIATPFVKWGTEVRHVEDLPMIINRAFKIAETPPTGPVFVSLPINIFNEQLVYENEPRTVSFHQTHPDSEAIKLAVDLLKSAKNPALIVEDGVSKNAALEAVVLFAEQIGSRVYQPWMADVNFPVNHPQYLYDLNVNSIETRELLANVDVLIVIGALFFSQAVYVPQPLVGKETKIIQIDDNPWQLGKNYQVACAIEGNIKITVSDLTMALKSRLDAGEVSQIQERKETIAKIKNKMVEEFEILSQEHHAQIPMHGTRLMREIRDAIPADTVIVDDCWSYSAILRRTIPFHAMKTYMRARGGGSIGWGLPGAIGVKMGAPNKPVVCISGDGSAMWSIQSLWTAAKYNIPVTFIILSNGCYRQVRLMKKILMGNKAVGRDLGTDISGPKNDFCKIAEGMGIKAQKIERPDELKMALQKAISTNEPNLIEILVDETL